MDDPKNKEKKLVINGQEWIFFVFRNMSFWHQFVSNYGHFRYFRDWGMDVPIRMMSISVNGTQTYVFKTPENKKESDEDILKLFSTKNKIDILKRRYIKFGKNLLDSLTDCLRSLTVKNWQMFEKNYTIYTHGLAVTATMGRTGMERLTQKLKDMGTREAEIPAIISIITYPKSHTPLFDSTLDLIKIGAAIQRKNLSKAEITHKLEKWLVKHSNIPVNFCDEPWSLTDAENQLNHILREDCYKELKELKKTHKQRVLAAKRKLEEINDKEVSLLAYALQETTYLNEFRKNIFSTVSLKMRPLFQKIAEKSGLNSWRECYYLLPEEIRDILRGKLKSAKNTIKNRKVVAVYIDDKDGKEKFLDKKNTKIVFDFVSLPHERKREKKEKEEGIRGFGASAGKAKGLVKIVLSSKDFHKLLPGEILVTIMTSVDFVPIMEKAAAFITNEGGITSHASIVAREMNKPCVIGTKIATQALKDGDLVEVDAEKGIVRILKRSK